MGLITLKCPACGGEPNLNEDRTEARCAHCGSKLLLPVDDTFKQLQETARKESARQEIANHEHLCDVAIRAGNFADVEYHARRILRLDPKNVGGSLSRAKAVYGRATYQNTGYVEIRVYLGEAQKWGGKREAYKVQQEWGGELFKEWFGKAAELKQTASDCYQAHDEENGSQKCQEAMQYATAALEAAPDEDRAYEALALMAGLVQLAPTLWQSPPTQLSLLEPLRIKRRLRKELRNWRWMRNRVESWRGQVQHEPYLPAILETVLNYILGGLTRKSEDVSRRIRQQDARLDVLGKELGLPWLVVRTDSPSRRHEERQADRSHRESKVPGGNQ